MLTEEKFQEINGDDWVLADGRTSSTEYFNATGKENIADLRGMFLRGLNAGRDDGKEDPDTSRVAGDDQAEELKSHTHTLKQHSLVGPNPAAFLTFANFNEPSATVPINYTGGAETRPNNVAVYWYIKVK
jgi:hypothetical protein